nr:ISL3 family transposase [Clostridium gasigenes]
MKHICIDDFAIRKRHTYGTVMIDMETRCIVDLIESRDTPDVIKWLGTYPNIEIVARDGSIAFKSAIDRAHPKAMQVNDRFHMIKNLVTSIKKAFQRLIIGRIEIPVTSEKAKQRTQYLTSLTRREKIIEAKSLRRSGHSYDEIASILKVSTTTTRKYVLIKEVDIPKETISVREKEHLDATNKVKYKAERVIMLHEKGLQIKEIAKLTGYSTPSISKYLVRDFNCVHGQYGTSRSGLLEPFRNEVLSLRGEGVKYEEITNRIREKGYTGSVAALRGFVAKEKRLAKDILKDKEPTELIDKKSLLKLLYKPIDKVKELNQSQMKEIIKKHPIVEKLLELLTEFKDMLGGKKSGKLKSWIEKTRNLNIKELNSYINGINSDYDAFRNAIIYSYNNGLAEGSVNKIKSIKRIMYGRNNFELLKYKVLQLESLKGK